jgi:hypothetical protein
MQQTVGRCPRFTGHATARAARTYQHSIGAGLEVKVQGSKLPTIYGTFFNQSNTTTSRFTKLRILI